MSQPESSKTNVQVGTAPPPGEGQAATPALRRHVGSLEHCALSRLVPPLSSPLRPM